MTDTRETETEKPHAEKVPTPLLLAKRRVRTPASETTLTEALQRSFPDLGRMCAALEIPTGTDLESWAQAEGTDRVRSWLDLEVSPSELVESASKWRDWNSSPLDALVREAHLSARPYDFGPHFKQYRVTYSDVLTKTRTDVAMAVYRWANQMGYERPAIMLRALEIARMYFKELVLSDRVQGKAASAGHLRRVGGATVISGRFEVQAIAEITEASEYLLDAASIDADSRTQELYLESLVQLYDATGDFAPLAAAMSFLSKADRPPLPTATWHLNATDVFLRVLDDPASADSEFKLSLADDHFQKAERIVPSNSEPVQRARLEMTRALLEHVRMNRLTGISSYCRGLSLPFGARHRLTIDGRLAGTWTALINAMIPLANAGEFLFRDLCADLLSRRARHFGNDESKVSDLQMAVDFRTGTSRQRPLVGERIRLAQAEDLLLLAQATASQKLRSAGLRLLVDEALESDRSPAALVLLARNLQEEGAFVPSLRTDAHFNTKQIHPFELAIRQGEPARLYSAAANRALKSRDVRRRDLGGRDGVWSIEEPSRLSGKTLVIKTMSVRRWRADVARTQRVSTALLSRPSKAFGVVEHLGTVPPENELDKLASEDPIKSVRQFVDGVTLREYLEANSEKAPGILAVTARYLALIQTVGADSEPCIGARRQLWSKELGRWLRFLTSSAEAKRLFELWWSVVSVAPLVLRRDAHALNWIVDSAGRILAADLDCVGWRPICYELAQLTEDYPFLELNDRTSRTRILSSYVSELRDQGVEVRDEESLVYYEAGMFARSTFALSNVLSSPRQRRHAVEILLDLRENATDPRVREIAKATHRAWALANNVSPEDGLGSLTDAERHRLSRSMSYHLRHNKNASPSTQGWIYVDDLVDMLQSAGVSTVPERVLAVAGALGEARFETRGDRIRARHGHSTKVDISVEDGIRPDFLYHGTSIRNLPSIIEARDGLRPMARRRVHLTERPSIALHAAARRKEPVVLMKIGAEHLADAGRATEDIWVTSRVPAELLSVVPVWEMFELLRERQMGT